MELERHIYFMKKALDLAKRGEYTVSPNPMVGCIIVKNGNIISEGWHGRAGEAHAEVIALSKVGGLAVGADMYITLEPCCHYNRTPPCTNAIIAAQIKRVIIPLQDPNPEISGRSIEILQNAGIEVLTGVYYEEALKLNQIFFHYQKSRTPYVIAKWAMSLDGKTITNINDDRKLSSEESLKHLHLNRAKVDAILIGANTAITDNPQLTCRDSKYKDRNPLRIVLSGKLNLPEGLRIFQNQNEAKTIIATLANSPQKQVEKFELLDIEVLRLNKNEQSQVDICSLLIELGKREITSLMVEGGSKTHSSFFKANCVNEVEVYLTPYVIANLSRKVSLNKLNVQVLSNDIFLKSFFE